VCRSAAVAAARFGVADAPGAGVVLTRTGRAFFSPADQPTATALLDRVRSGFDALGLWDDLATDWAVLDCELLPWSAKAGELLRTQYAAVGAAATSSLAAEAAVLSATATRLAGAPGDLSAEAGTGGTLVGSSGTGGTRTGGIGTGGTRTGTGGIGTGVGTGTDLQVEATAGPVGAGPQAHASAEAAQARALAERAGERAGMAGAFVDAYRHYCWPTDGLDGLALAPFQVLATEGEVHALRPHPWHIDLSRRLVAHDPVTFRATRTMDVDLTDASSEASAVAWWEELTAAGGEGMVVKPRDVVVTTGRGIAQPGVKCRGREYLRIVYGPEYTTPHQLGRLRERGLGHKRALALREFALGIEALERFVARRPLHRVHECVFGVLALESEPVDPRL